MVNRITSSLTVLFLVGGLVYCLNLYQPESLLFVALAVGACLLAWVLWAIYRRQVGVESELSFDDTPLAAMLLGLRRSVVVNMTVVLVLLIAWGFGFWQPSWQTLSVEKTDAYAQVVAKPVLETLPTTTENPKTSTLTLSCQVVAFESYKNTHFIDVIVPTPDAEGETPLASCPLDGFVVKVDSFPQAIGSVTRVTWEEPAAFVLLRDVSGSVTTVKQFQDIEHEVTEQLVTKLLSDSRETVLRIVDFSASSKEVLAWTKLPIPLGEFPLSRLPEQASSAVTNCLAVTVDEIAARLETCKVMILLSDFANNVPSASTDAYGILAAARKNEVSLHFISLPTKDFRHSKVLQMLAKQTGGTYLDGAAPNLAKSLEKLLATTKKPWPAYRLTIAGESEIDQELISVSVAIPQEIPSPTPLPSLGSTTVTASVIK